MFHVEHEINFQNIIYDSKNLLQNKKLIFKFKLYLSLKYYPLNMLINAMFHVEHNFYFKMLNIIFN